MQWPWSKSIARRIQWGYYVLVALVAISTMLLWSNLSQVRKRIVVQEATAELMDSVLEMRRYEKNWILYGEKADFDANLAEIQKVSNLVDMHREDFYTLGSQRILNEFIDKVETYRGLMAQGLRAGGPRPQEAALEEIRRTGRELVGLATLFRQEEHEAIYATLDLVTFSGFLFGLVVTFLAVLLGQQLAISVVRPLQKIVRYTRLVSKGSFTPLKLADEAVEIVSLVQAFHVMIAELKKREEQIYQSKKLAALGTLVAGVAHELNNPLSNIGTSAQILLEELDQGEAEDKEFCREMLSQIVEQTDRTKRIVRSLLEFSRQRVFRRERLGMRAFLEETSDLIRGRIPTRVEFCLDVKREGLFTGEKQRLQQVVLNLLLNAFHAVGDQGRVVLRGDVDEEAEQAFIEVEDDGPGIPPHILGKIFDPFFTTKEVGEGSGLGLSIAHEIVTQHGGTIQVRTKEGTGTRFVITLPTKEQQDTESEDGNGEDTRGG